MHSMLILLCLLLIWRPTDCAPAHGDAINIFPPPGWKPIHGDARHITQIGPIKLPYSVIIPPGDRLAVNYALFSHRPTGGYYIQLFFDRTEEKAVRRWAQSFPIAVGINPNLIEDSATEYILYGANWTCVKKLYLQHRDLIQITWLGGKSIWVLVGSRWADFSTLHAPHKVLLPPFVVCEIYISAEAAHDRR
jgi:hypothetical protein